MCGLQLLCRKQEFFPHIFGPEEAQPLDADAARAALANLAKEINASTPSGQPEKSPDEVRPFPPLRNLHAGG